MQHYPENLADLTNYRCAEPGRLLLSVVGKAWLLNPFDTRSDIQIALVVNPECLKCEPSKTLCLRMAVSENAEQNAKSRKAKSKKVALDKDIERKTEKSNRTAKR